MHELLRRFWYLVRRRRFDADLREELQLHREMAGPVAFGSGALAQDESRDVWTPRLVQGLGQDIRLGFRSLRRTPVVTAVALVSLALGIGANTAIFSIVNGLILRPLPVKDPAQLAIIDNGASFSYPVWAEIRRRPELFDGAFAWSTPRFNLSRGGVADFADGIWVSGRLFETLDVQPLLGRLIADADDQPASGARAAVAVVSYGFWQRRFGGASDVVGRTLSVQGAPFTIVGVTPPAFFGPEVGRAFEVALPLNARPLVEGSTAMLDDPRSRALSIMIRRKTGQSLDEATAALRAVQPQIRQATAPTNVRGSDLASYLPAPWTLTSASTGLSALRSRFERPAFILLIVVVLVLLIACFNIASLLLIRTVARGHELSVRVALGASRWRLARPLIVESLLLSAGGALLGVWFAREATPLVVGQLSSSVSRVFLGPPLDARVLTFTTLTMLTTSLTFGALPAWYASRGRAIGVTKQHGHAVSGPGGLRMTGALVIVQVALSLVLVVGTGLFVRSFATLVNRDIGFDRRDLLVATVSSPSSLREPARRLELYERSLDAVRQVPGVVSAGFSVFSPLTRTSSSSTVRVVGESRTDESSLLHWISPGWFATYRTVLLAGRDFTPFDRKEAAPVAIVNEAYVRQFFGGRSPIGRFIKEVPLSASAPTPVREVVGVVDNAVYLSVREPPRPTVYFPLAQSDALRLSLYTSVSIGLRTAGPPMALSRGIAARVAEVNPDASVSFREMKEQVDAALTQERLVAILSAFFGALALLLAALGLYGVTAYGVVRRRAELGVRIALGASASGVVQLVLWRALGLVGVGIAAGAIASLWASRFVASLLYGLEPNDPLTLLTAALALAAVALIAASLPAWRASRLDPATVLRSE